MTAQVELWSARAAARHRAEIERLVPLAVELASKAGLHGVTCADLRIVAVQRALLTGQEQGRTLSFLGATMKAAGLRNTGTYRRSHIDRSHGNLHAIWSL